jgi:succinoglycan biosynthesis transport protein ExoP
MQPSNVQDTPLPQNTIARTRAVPANQEYVPDDNYVARYLSAVGRHKFLIFATIVLSLALCSLAIVSVRPLYRAEAAVMIEPRQTNVVDVKSVLPGFDLTSNSSAAIIATEVSVLRGEPLMRKVIERLDLLEDPRFLRQGPFALLRWSFLDKYLMPVLVYLEPAAASGDKEEDQLRSPGMVRIVIDEHERAVAAAVARYQRDLTVESDGRSFIITVQFKSTDKELAAIVANTHVQMYLQQQQAERTKAEQSASKWLEDQNAQLNDNAVRADQAVQQYRRQHKLAVLPSGDGHPTSELQQQLIELNTQLSLASANLAEKAAQASALRRILRSPGSPDAMQSVAQIVNSPLIDQLRQQEAEVLRREADLTAQFGDKYPTVRRVRAELESVRGKIRQEIGKIATSIEREAAVAQGREASLRKSLKTLGSQAAEQNALEIKLHELEQEAASTREVYRNFFNRQQEVSAQIGLQHPDARAVEASVPLHPYFPNALLLLSLTLAGSSLGSVGLSLVADRSARGFRSSTQIEDTCGVPVFGALSDVKGSLFRRPTPADEVVQRPSSAFAEQIHEIRVACQSAVRGDDGKILLVTSCLPNEGKSVLALSLARALAISGHSVLLCDCDLRRSSIGRLIGDARLSVGFVDYLRGDCKWEDAVRQDTLSTLHYTAPSKPPRAPSALLAPENIGASFATLRQRYQFIVVDSPPLAPVADARALVQIADCAVFVVRWMMTPRAIAQTLVQRIISARDLPVGVVLSRVDMNKKASFEEGDVEKYYRKYKKYYAHG